jgi:hypothetical protein
VTTADRSHAILDLVEAKWSDLVADANKDVLSFSWGSGVEIYYWERP